MKKVLFVVILLISVCNVSWGAKMWFSTNKTYLTENCPTKIDVMLDTEGQMTTAMDFRMFLNPNSFVLNDFDGNGGLFKVYALPIMSTIPNGSFAGKEVMYSILSTMSRWGVKGSGKVGSVTITPVTGSTSVDLQIYMLTGNDVDDTSVIVISGGNAYDVLNQVDKLSLEVKPGICDEEMINILEQRQNLIFAEIQNKQNAKVIVMQNKYFQSQFVLQELVDKIMSWIVVNFMTVILIGLLIAVILGIRIMVKIYRKLSMYKIDIKT